MENRKLFSNASWSVEFSPEDRCLVVTTSDYHAKPLRIPEELWRALGKEFRRAAEGEAGIAMVAAAIVNEDEPNQLALTPRAGSGTAGRPADRVEVVRKVPWTVSSSRREKRVYVECDRDPQRALVISRKELYRIGRSMSGSK